MTWWTLFLWSTKKDFWFLYMEKKKQSLDENSIFWHTRNIHKQFFSLRFKLLKDLLTSWCIFSKIIFFSQIKALYIVYCYQGCLGSLINTWRNKINIFLKLWHSSNLLYGFIKLLTPAHLLQITKWHYLVSAFIPNRFFFYLIKLHDKQ